MKNKHISVITGQETVLKMKVSSLIYTLDAFLHFTRAKLKVNSNHIYMKRYQMHNKVSFLPCRGVKQQQRVRAASRSRDLFIFGVEMLEFFSDNEDLRAK